VASSRRRSRVRWAEVAVRDLEDLVAYLKLDSPVNAERVLDKLEQRATKLETSPARGRVIPELARFGMHTWRELLIEPYRLIYRIESDTVTVLALFDGRRELEDLLLERLVRSP
jgi:addiction module RelE/StbE family toxin